MRRAAAFSLPRLCSAAVVGSGSLARRAAQGRLVSGLGHQPLPAFACRSFTSHRRSLGTRRALPPSVHVTERASTRIAALLKAADGTPLGVRMGMANDWGSVTGFTYTLKFVREGELQASDERIELSDSAVLFIERKALWVGEGGLLGSTVDIDEKMNIIVTPKIKDEPV